MRDAMRVEPADHPAVEVDIALLRTSIVTAQVLEVPDVALAEQRLAVACAAQEAEREMWAAMRTGDPLPLTQSFAAAWDRPPALPATKVDVGGLAAAIEAAGREGYGVTVMSARNRLQTARAAQRDAALGALRAAMLADDQPAVRVCVTDLEVALRDAEAANVDAVQLAQGRTRLGEAQDAAARREAAETDLAAAMQEGPPVEVDCARLDAAILEAERWEVAVEVARDRALL